MKTWEAAVIVLRETAVMWGDAGLLDSIFVRAGLSVQDQWRPNDRWAAVLGNLSRSPGPLVAGTTLSGPRRVRIFWLPEHAPVMLSNAGEM